MTVCFFGIYNPDYSRSKVIINGLRENGVRVIICRTEKKGILKYFDLIKKHWKIRNSYDVLFVAFPGFQSVILAKFLTRKPIIFDAFLSLYDSMVLDRKQAKEKSLKAKYYWWLDKISMSIADFVLMDTNEHKKYVSKEFGIDDKKIERLFLGADTNIFYPRKVIKTDSKFRVLFYGTYIPLQGVEYIIKAAKILEKDKDIIFELIGSGQEKGKILELAKDLELKNVVFKDNVPLIELPDYISTADVCLGVFGDTDKAERVIPNKVYESVACGKLVITAKTKAIEELFINGKDIILCKKSDSSDLAAKILSLKKKEILGEDIGINAWRTFEERLLGKNLIKELLLKI